MKKLLVISPIPTYPISCGCSERVYRFLLEVEKLGYEIFFAYINCSLLESDESMMQKTWKSNFISIPYTFPQSILKIGIKAFFNRFLRQISRFLRLSYFPVFSIDEWYDNSVDKFFKNLSTQNKFDIVIVEYVFFSKALENFDNSVLKVIDTHDVFTNRHKLYQANGENPSFFYTNSFNEKKGLERADRVISIQNLEKNFFQQKLGLTDNVYTIGHFVELDNLFNPDLDNKIIFFGSSNLINVKGINFFLKEILPEIKRQISDLDFIIGGSICNCLNDSMAYQKLGFFEDKKLLYKQATVIINPMLFGTGIKIKNVESLGYGIPLVTTTIGAEGLEDGINKAFLVADSAQEFVQKIIKILSDKEYRLNLSNSALQYAKDINNKNVNNLKSLLDTNTINLDKPHPMRK